MYSSTYTCVSSTLEGDDWSASRPDYFPQRKSSRYPLGEPQSQSECCGEEKRVSLPLESKSIFLSIARSLITELFQLYLIYIALLPLPFEEDLRFSQKYQVMVLLDVTLYSSVDRY
jgi:hypothetical protein